MYEYKDTLLVQKHLIRWNSLEADTIVELLYMILFFIYFLSNYITFYLIHKYDLTLTFLYFVYNL